MIPRISFVLLFLAAAPALAQPIRLHPENPHYFLWRNEPTVLVTSAEHYGAVLNLDFDYATYLRTLEQDGLNYTRIFSGSYVEKPGAFGIEKNTLAPLPGRYIAPWARSDEPGYINGGNRFDLDRWDPAYFERLKAFVAEADRRGIVVEVTLFCPFYNDDLYRFSPLHPANNVNDTDSLHRDFVYTLDNGNLLGYQEAMVRKIVRELNEFDNVFFEIENEADVTSNERIPRFKPYLPDWLKELEGQVHLAAEPVLEWQRRIASIIVDEESRLPKRHLIAQDFANVGYPLSNIDPNVSIINFHYARPLFVEINYGHDRVIGFDESGFSGSDDDVYRRQAWAFMLAGGGLFNNLDYSFTTDREDGADTNDAPGGGSPTFRKQMKVLKDFLESFDFIHMEPDEDVVVLAPNAFPQALANPGRAYAIYLDGELQGDLILDLPAGNYTAEWVDTKTGVIEKSERFDHTGGRTSLNAPDYTRDIALRVTAHE